MSETLTPLQTLAVHVKTEFDVAEKYLSPKAYRALLEISRLEIEIRLGRLAVDEAETITRENS